MIFTMCFPFPRPSGPPANPRFMFFNPAVIHIRIYLIYILEICMHMQCRCAWGSSWEDMYTSSPSTPSCARRVLYYRLRIRRPGGRGRRSMILRIPPFSEPSRYTRQSHEGCAVSLYSRSSTHFGRMGTTRVGCKEPVNEGFNVGVPRLPPSPHP